MSCFTVQVLEPSGKIIEVETCAGHNVSSIVFENYTSPNISLSECVAQLPSDFNDRIFAVVSGDIVPSTGVNIVSSGGKIYLNSILNASDGIGITHNSGIYTISTTGLQPSGNYASGIHYHLSSDITNFNNSVSGLLPITSLISGSGINISNINSQYTVSVTGNFGLTGEQVDDRVNDLLSAGSYVVLDYDNNSLTISVTGLQPTGDYSIVGHSHNTSDINDFNSAVSGLLPATYDAAVPWTPNHTLADGTRYLANDLVYENGRLYKANYDNESLPVSNTLYWTDVGAGYRLNIDGRDIPNIPYPVTNLTAGSGIGINNVGTDYTISVTGTFGLTGEQVDDRVSSLLVAGSNIVLNYDTNSDSLTISTSGLQPSGNYSLIGHTHISNDITDFNSAVSGLIPLPTFTSLSGVSGILVTNSGTNYTVSLNDPTIQLSDITDLSSDARSFLSSPTSSNLQTLITNETGSGLLVFNDSPAFSGIPTVPTAPSGTNTSQIANTAFVRSEISNLVNSAPTTLDTLNELASALGNDPNFATTIVSGLSQKANLVHSHVVSDITDFNSGVSGLIPVKDIISGTDISISSSSGIYTINSSNSVSIDTKEPDGFVNRSDSTLSFDDSSREFTIAPTGASYVIYNNGVKVTKTASETITLPDTTALYFIHFDKSDNSLSYKTTAYNFVTDIPIAHIYYNADDNKAVYFGEERHGIVMDSATHKYLHTVFGTQYINGLSISNYSISGNGSSNSDATIAISDGLIYDEDIDVNITHSDTPSNPFEQVLYPIAVIPVYYKVGSSGVWTNSTATNFPVKVGTTIQYNLNNAGTWSASNSDAPNNNRYIASWICATSQENAPIIAIMGQRIDSSLEQATSNNSWSNLNLNGLPVVELRPLYRLIYDTKSSFTNGAKGFLVNILDIRSHIDTITGLPQNDHGNLYGLADDDHYQYVHIDEPRTIDAIHTFNNGLISNDDITVSGTIITHDTVQFTDGTYNATLQKSTLTDDRTINLPDANGTVVLRDNSILTSAAIDQYGQLVIEGGVVAGIQFGANGKSFRIDSQGYGFYTDYGGGNYYTTNFVPTATQSRTINIPDANGTLTLDGHTHSSSDITDFNSSVSGLLPVTDIIGGTNISVVPSGSIFTVSVSGSLGLTTEEVDDRISNLLVAGSGISLNYDDNGDSLTISTTSNSILSDVVGSTNYIGLAAAGSSTSSSVWTIRRTIYTSGGSVSSTATATNVKWDDRLTETYI
jgi:hypothetical protein